MAGKLFLTCAVTGSSPMPDHPNFPFRPDHVAAEALAAAQAGAAIIHLHVRDRETGDPSQALDDYREVVGLIRAKNDEVILNVTTGPGCTWMQSDDDPAVCGPGTLMFTAERRLEHNADLVRWGVEMVERMGGDIASAGETRAMLGLKQ
ncbi:3-keto-5-aminohexanoate cleavage protein [Sphingobium sp. R-7]|uniref:3-keto-5-aminohexanoate cleavage protein n=1 Tax=Sphingobium sp. R-7 TaxID=3375449 RepID=UPI00398B1428